SVCLRDISWSSASLAARLRIVTVVCLPAAAALAIFLTSSFRFGLGKAPIHVVGIDDSGRGWLLIFCGNSGFFDGRVRKTGDFLHVERKKCLWSGGLEQFAGAIPSTPANGE